MEIVDKVHVQINRFDLEDILTEYFRKEKGIELKKIDVKIGTYPKGNHDIPCIDEIKMEDERV